MIGRYVMNDVPSVPIGDFENEQREAMRLYSNVGTVSQTVRSGNGPYNAPCPPRALHTVFLHYTNGTLNNAM